MGKKKKKISESNGNNGGGISSFDSDSHQKLNKAFKTGSDASPGGAAAAAAASPSLSSNVRSAAVNLDDLEYEDPLEDEEIEELAVLGSDDEDEALDAEGYRRDRSAAGHLITTKVWLPPGTSRTASSSSVAGEDTAMSSEAAAGGAEGGGSSGPRHTDFKPDELTYDPSAYDMLHALRLEWPCLSFDIVRDSLGLQRRRYPHTMYIAAGTQADVAKNNRVLLLRLSELSRTGIPDDNDDVSDDDDDNTKRKGNGIDGGDKDDDGDAEDDALSSSDEDDEDRDPLVHARAIRHTGCVNRLRCLPQRPEILATWADTGKVHVFSMAEQYAQLQKQPTVSSMVGGNRAVAAAAAAASAAAMSKNMPAALVAPLQSFTSHPTEGFALSWSPLRPGRLLSGDCRKHIYLWEPQGDTLTSWAVNAAPFVGHEDSVEDVQWKPDEDDVFASCSVDRTVKVWDARAKQQPALSIVAHDSDVNVLAWNPHVSYLLATGADDGSFRIFDLRALDDGKPEAHFDWHSAPITSLEWSPDEESVIGVSCEQQVTIWDLSLERDAEEENEAQAGGELPLPDSVPAQLLFVHMGQLFIKEMHWHKQIPGAVLSTAADGFNVWRASNI